MAMFKKSILLIAVISYLFISSKMLIAKDAARLTSGQMQSAAYVDSLSVPCAGELFAAINKVSRPNWSELSHGVCAPVTNNRAQLALAIGVLITNGYIAVEAQDGQQVKNIGRDVVAMAKALGVGKNILSRGNNLIEFADHNQWDTVRDELEAIDNEVKAAMIEQKDRDLITLISSGTWLRGVEVSADLMTKHYSKKGAALLYQPELARHLAKSLEALPERLSNDVLVINVKNTLNSIANLLEKNRDVPSKASLLIIETKTAALMKEIDQSLPLPPTVQASPALTASEKK